MPLDSATTAHGEFESLSLPTWRASTIVFDSLDQFTQRKLRLPDGYFYGTTGTPTQRELERRIAVLDDAENCVVLPSGQAAICAVLFATLKLGDHLLMTEAAYGPAKAFASSRLAALGINVQFYNPRIGAEIGGLIRPNTRVVWLESPGSITMELQDVASIAREASRHGVLTVLDNSWASPLGFHAFDHGVDVVVHACTKYLSGHSDVLMGSVSTRDGRLHASIRALQAEMGLAVSADDCFLVARGLETLELRQQRQAATALFLAKKLAAHPAVTTVLYPPFPAHSDHALWARDHALGGCVLSFSLADPAYDVHRIVFGALKRFRIGASWGGVTSVAAYYSAEDLSGRRYSDTSGPIIRLSAGLEDSEALWNDLEQALSAISSSSRDF